MGEKICEVLGMEEKDYNAKYKRYARELEDILRTVRRRTAAAERMIKWLTEGDEVVKMIVIFNLLDSAAERLNIVITLANTLKATKEYGIIGELLLQLVR